QPACNPGATRDGLQTAKQPITNSRESRTNIMPESFALERIFSASLLDEITEIRIHRPEIIEEEARRRQRRPRLTRDGKLVLVALDHPARAVTKIRNDE